MTDRDLPDRDHSDHGFSRDDDHRAMPADPIDELARQVAAAGVAPAAVRDESELLMMPGAADLDDDALEELDEDALEVVAEALGVPREPEFGTEADDLSRIVVSEETRALMTPEVNARLLALLETRRGEIERQIDEARTAAERDAFFARWPKHLEHRRAELDRRIAQLK